MDEKVMVSDALAGLNASLSNYAGYIAQTETAQLRQELINIRNADEGSQYQLFNIAKKLGYYKPAQKASDKNVDEVKQMVSQG